MARPRNKKPSCGIFWFPDYEGGDHVREMLRLAKEADIPRATIEGCWFIAWRRFIHNRDLHRPVDAQGRRITGTYLVQEWDIGGTLGVQVLDIMRTSGVLKITKQGHVTLPNPDKSLCSKDKARFWDRVSESKIILNVPSSTEKSRSLSLDPIRSDPIQSDRERETRARLPAADRSQLDRDAAEFLGRPLSTRDNNVLDHWAEAYPPEWCRAAMAGAKAKGIVTLDYATGFLRRYAAQGGPDPEPQGGSVGRGPLRSRAAEIKEALGVNAKTD